MAKKIVDDQPADQPAAPVSLPDNTVVTMSISPAQDVQQVEMDGGA